MVRSSRVLLAAGALAALCGCDGEKPSTDAGPLSRRLTIVGDADVGLKPGEGRVLRVAYGEAGGPSLAGARVQFAIFGDPRGSTLSADTSSTDENGQAAVLVRAGAVTCRFQVRVQATAAPEATFYVEVSSAGFGSLAAHSAYQGTALRPEVVVEVRYELLGGLLCSSVDPAAPPPPLRERVASSMVQPVEFKALPLDRDHSLLALASNADLELAAWGCVDIPRQLPQPDRELSLAVPLRDFQPRLSGSFAVGSSLTLPQPGSVGARPLREMLRPFVDLADCPLDPAQLLIDCIVDAADPGDPLDCQVTSPSPAALAIQAQRGVTGPQGCRGAVTAQGGQSLEDLVHGAMKAAGQPVLAALQALPSAAPATLGAFELASRLEVLSVDADGRLLVARHVLESVGFRRGTDTAVLKLLELGLPALEAAPVSIELSGWKASIREHGFSLRFGKLARLALGKLHLSAAGLPETSSGVGDSIASLVSRQGKTGCVSLDEAICDAARLPAGCLAQACPEGLKALGSYLDSGFAASEVKATDFSWAGQAQLEPGPKTDGALRVNVDRIGTHQAPGVWAARLVLGQETVSTAQATFQAKKQ